MASLSLCEAGSTFPFSGSALALGLGRKGIHSAVAVAGTTQGTCRQLLTGGPFHSTGTLPLKDAACETTPDTIRPKLRLNVKDVPEARTISSVHKSNSTAQCFNHFSSNAWLLSHLSCCLAPLEPGLSAIQATTQVKRTRTTLLGMQLDVRGHSIMGRHRPGRDPVRCGGQNSDAWNRMPLSWCLSSGGLYKSLPKCDRHHLRHRAADAPLPAK